MGNYVPPVKGGKVIGRPYQGTHGRAFNRKGGSDNWESENAVDIAVPVGTPIYAVEDGTIGKQIGLQGGGRFAGQRVHLKGKNGEFFYGHLSAIAAGIRPGAKVKAGDLIGYSGEANGVAHLHFASTTNLSPMNVIKGLSSTPEDPVQLPGINAPADGSGGVQPTTLNDKGYVDPTLAQQQGAAIDSIPQVGGAPLAQAPLTGGTDVGQVTPMQSSGDTWQLIAAQGNVSQDTLRLAQLASLSGNGSPN